MNNDRRKQLASVAPILAQIAELKKQAHDAISCVKDEEQEAFDNLSEGRQQGDSGQAMEAAISAMDTALEELDSIDTEDLITAINEATDRSLDVDAIKGRLTKAEAEQRREARVPKWARDRYSQLVEKNVKLEEKLKAQYAEPNPKKPGTQILIEDYMSPQRGRVLPFDMVKIGEFVIEPCDHMPGAVQIRHNGFSALMTVLPRSSNEVIVTSMKDR